MIRFLSFLLLLFMLSFRGNSQEILYSSPEKFSFQNGDFAVVGWSGDYLFAYSASKEGYFLNGYTDSMKLAVQVSLDFFPQKIYDTKFINYNDRILVLYQAIQAGDVVQYAALLDNKGLLQGRPISLGTAKTGWFASNKKEYFSSVISEDKSKIMILGWSQKNNSFTTILIDKDLNILNRSKQQLELSNYNFKQALLNNNGELFLTAFSQVGSRNYSDDIVFIHLPMDAKKAQLKKMPLNGKYINGINSKIDLNTGNIVSAGFYADKKNGNIEGIIHVVLNAATLEFEQQKFINLDDKIRKTAGEKNKNKALNNYEVRQIVIKNDGGFLLVAENAYITTRSSSPAGYGFYSSYYYAPFGNNSIREYVFGPIFAINCDANSQVLWYNFIRKDQYSQEDGGLFSSYAFMNTGASLSFLFNNFTTRNSSLTFSVLSESGQVDFSNLSFSTSSHGDWIPRYAVQTDITEWVVPVLRGNSLSFAKIEF